MTKKVALIQTFASPEASGSTIDKYSERIINSACYTRSDIIKALIASIHHQTCHCLVV